MATFAGNPPADPLDGSEAIPLSQAGVDKRTTPAAIAAFVSSLSIITEASTSTMDPATHAGLNRYIRAADDVTFDVAETYAAGQVFNIRATAGLTLIGTGVTLTAPAGGTLDLDAAMSVTVVMTSATTADVIGQTVPA